MFSTILGKSDIAVHALASGSSGNATLVKAGDTNLLIDAGLPLRKLSQAMARYGVGVNNLDAILLTHEHADHSSGAGPISRRTGAPIVANARTLDAYAFRDALPVATQLLRTGGTLGIGSLSVRSFAVSHDAVEAVGFVVETHDCRVAYFTDAGMPTEELRGAIRGAKLAVMEANHDIDWLLRGPYTPEMKARVAAPTGHLSNGDCADLLAERLDEGGPLCVWLAHLSRVNNSPSLARRTVTARVKERTDVPFSLEVALRDHPSVSWRSGARAVQLSLL